MKKVKVFWEKVGGFEKMTIMKYRKYKGLECREAMGKFGGGSPAKYIMDTEYFLEKHNSQIESHGVTTEKVISVLENSEIAYID